ncbi:S-phase kinase-associated protein 1 [Copidosoma floridanum]|uniref:S-phase kinase-associated protein 1 n=1 Tax=Copidosoma floridanum TaxID=29053 RepID=UPI0006C95C7D|nr:S-phase kinase-associated protein 1 [Copidosoma floridanum]
MSELPKKVVASDKVQTIKLLSNDNKTFTVDVKVARCSTTFKTMLDDLGLDENDDDDEPLYLSTINSEILKKILKWCEYHKDDPPVDEDDYEQGCASKSADMSEWDAEYFKVSNQTLFDILLTANYLDIKGLVDAACKKIASMIKGKTSEEIRKTFEAEHDKATN